MAENFGDTLASACLDKRSAVCVGLDPRWESLPESIRGSIDAADPSAVAKATQCYCQEVIDAVASQAAIIKPQAAFFEQLGPAGMQALAGVIQHARRAGLLVLLDAKRGDIGSTAAGYAAAYLGPDSAWQCDALTVNPYLGDDTLLPFVEAAHGSGSGLFVLVKTSNPGSGFLQDLGGAGLPQVYEHVAAHVQGLAKQLPGRYDYGSVGAVVGATYPAQLAELRRAMPNAWILIPGFGAQGGTAEDVKHGFGATAAGPNGSMRLGAIVNSSRGIIFAYRQPEYAELAWQDAVAQAAGKMREQLLFS